MKTAMQQLIEKLEENRDMFKDNSRPITAAYQNSLNLAKGLLEEEKKQIKDAYGHTNKKIMKTITIIITATENEDGTNGNVETKIEKSDNIPFYATHQILGIIEWAKAGILKTGLNNKHHDNR